MASKAFEIIRYESQFPITKIGQAEVKLCPYCIEDGVYGVVTDNFCSGCGKSFGHVVDAELKEKVAPQRQNISWRAKIFKGMSLNDMTRVFLKEGKTITQIAADLSLLSGKEISVANVSIHAKGMSESRKGKVKYESDEMITILHVLRTQSRGTKIPQQVLAIACNVSQSMISQIENGVCVSSDVLSQLTLTLGWLGTPDELIKPWNGANLSDRVRPFDECELLKIALEVYKRERERERKG